MRTRFKKRIAQRRLESLERKKYWGTGKLIKDYEDAVVSGVDTERLEKTMRGFGEEGLVDDIVSQIDFDDLFKASLVDELEGFVAESFKQGGSRVLTVDGDRLDPFSVDPVRIIDQLQQQEIYLQKLSGDAEERARKILTEGLDEGKTVSELTDDVLEGVQGLTRQRAETISRSEIITASARGTQEALDEAGVDVVEVDASVDRQTCDPGTFDFRASDGRRFTSCEEWDGERFERGSEPTPVRDSHPNCRCALLAVVE